MQAASERKALPSHLDGDQMDAPFRWGELFIKDGKLARYIGCKPSKDRPEVELIYQQTTIRLESCGEDDPVIARIIGQVLQSENGEVYSGYGGYTRVDVRGGETYQGYRASTQAARRKRVYLALDRPESVLDGEALPGLLDQGRLSAVFRLWPLP